MKQKVAKLRLIGILMTLISSIMMIIYNVEFSMKYQDIISINYFGFVQYGINIVISIILLISFFKSMRTITAKERLWVNIMTIPMLYTVFDFISIIFGIGMNGTTYFRQNYLIAAELICIAGFVFLCMVKIKLSYTDRKDIDRINNRFIGILMILAPSIIKIIDGRMIDSINVLDTFAYGINVIISILLLVCFFSNKGKISAAERLLINIMILPMLYIFGAFIINIFYAIVGRYVFGFDYLDITSEINCIVGFIIVYKNKILISRANNESEE